MTTTITYLYKSRHSHCCQCGNWTPLHWRIWVPAEVSGLTYDTDNQDLPACNRECARQFAEGQ